MLLAVRAKYRAMTTTIASAVRVAHEMISPGPRFWSPPGGGFPRELILIAVDPSGFEGCNDSMKLSWLKKASNVWAERFFDSQSVTRSVM